MSRLHAALHIVKDTVEVEDLGSTNGTWVQDMQLEQGRRVPLPLGGALRTGDVVLLVHHAAVVERLGHQTDSTTAPPRMRAPADIIVVDPAMLRLHDMVGQVAAGPINVLVLGETGVGKDIIARLLHRMSSRADQIFMPINCPALPPTLVEAELFGHQRGAFTGATESKAGLLESANGGTVFLDEVGELPLAVQAKLLRVLEDRCVQPVGSAERRPIDVRFIAATNRDLEAEARTGSFRSDLYFRLNGASLEVPPLRLRVVEIEPLARKFLADYCELLGRATVPALSAAAIDRLEAHDWPGNIRELRNTVERAVLLCQSGEIDPDHLPLARPPAPGDDSPEPGLDRTQRVRLTIPSGGSGRRSEAVTVPPPARTELRSAVEDFERQQIVAALEECGGNQTRAAKLLGISRRGLLKKLDKLDIPRPRKG